MIQSKELTLASGVATKIIDRNSTRVGFKVINNEVSQAIRVKVGSAPGTADATEVRTISFGGLTPGSGSFKVKLGDALTAAIASSANAAAVQTAIRTLPGMGSVTVAGSFSAGFAVTMTGAPLPSGPFSIKENTLKTAGTAGVQTLAFSGTPTQGTLQLKMLMKDFGNFYRELVTDKLTVAQLATATLQAYLRGFLGDAGLTVGGSFGAGLTITSSAGQPQGLCQVVENTLAAADTEEVQTISFAAEPTEGGFKLSYGQELVGDFTFESLAADIQAALRLLPGFGSVTVSGDFSTGFVVTFVGVDSPTLLSIPESTLDEVAEVELTTPYAQGGARTVTPSLTTKPVEPVMIGSAVAITTPGTSDSDGETVAGGGTLDYSTNGGSNEVWAIAVGGTAAIDVIEVF